MILTNNEINRRQYNAEQIIFYHDEYAYESDPDVAEYVGQEMVAAMGEAGRYYNLKLPIDGKYAIGRDWSIH